VDELCSYQPVYVVFIGSCSPMVDIFRCDDLLFHESDEFWVYKPDFVSLRQKMLMSFGTCQLAPSYAEKDRRIFK
jgi:glycogenin glucosyltransferase